MLVKLKSGQFDIDVDGETSGVKPVVHRIVLPEVSKQATLNHLNTNGITVDKGTWKIISAVKTSAEPLNLMSIGDSWAEGRAEEGAIGDANPETLYEISGTTITEVTTDVADRRNGSPYPAMANKLNELTGRPIHFLNQGMSGGAIYRSEADETWGSTGTLFNGMVQALNDARTVMQGSGDIDVIYMNLGGVDAALDTINADTAPEFQLLIDKIKTEIPNVKIFLNLLPGNGWWSPEMDQIRAIQENIVANNDFVYVAADVGELSEGIAFNTYLYDGLHPAHVYSEEMGEVTAESIAAEVHQEAGSSSFILTGVGTGTYGNDSIPLTLDNLYEIASGVFSGGNAGLIPKEIDATDEYIVKSDDWKYLLMFTANAGEEIQLIYNENTLPDNSKSIVAMSTGDNYLIPTVGTEEIEGTVTFGVPAGSLLKTTGENSLITLQPKGSVNDLAVWGSLEGETIDGREVKLVSDGSGYVFKEEDKNKFLILGGTDILVSIPNNTFESTELKGVFGGVGTMEFDSLDVTNPTNIVGVAVPEGKTRRVVEGGYFTFNFQNTDGGYLSGDLVEEAEGEHAYEFKVGMTYTIVPEDQGKTLYFADPATITIPADLENKEFTKPVRIINGSPTNNTEKGIITIQDNTNSVLKTPEGYLPKIKSLGSVTIDKWYNEMDVSGDLVEKKEEKYIVTENPNQVIDFQPEDATKFLNIRNSNGGFDLTMHIPSGVFENGDVIEGYSHYGNDFRITSDLNYTRFPDGVTNAYSANAKCTGYFKIRFTSTSATTPNASSAMITGDFAKEYEVRQSPDGTLWKVSVDNSGNEVITAL